jgi:hypothetical protein
MNKKILLTAVDFNIKSAFYKELDKFFSIQKFDQHTDYSKENTILYLYCTDSLLEWQLNLINQNFKSVIDALYEPKSFGSILNFDVPSWYQNYHVLNSKYWFWYLQSTTANQDYLNYTPNRCYKKTALMPMRLCRNHRDRLYTALTPYLNDFYYSYLEQGMHHLPEDLADTVIANKTIIHFVNKVWFDDTYFSIVAETYDDSAVCYRFGKNKVPYNNDVAFLTEKTFKPIAMQHPFMIYGQTNSLDLLHQLGFETFENLFDESYDHYYPFEVEPNGDLEIDKDYRLNIIVNNVKNFNHQPYDELTLKKIKHNFYRLSDTKLITDLIHQDVMLPLVNFANDSTE